jgi:hypothetical protein
MDAVTETEDYSIEKAVAWSEDELGNWYERYITRCYNPHTDEIEDQPTIGLELSDELIDQTTPDPDWEQTVARGRELARQHDKVQWELGEWWNAATQKYGDGREPMPVS